MEKANNRSVELELPHVPKEERGIQFFNGKFTIRTANRLELRQKAYKLLYNIYSEMGIIRNNHSGLWLSIFEALPETTTLIAENHHGKIVGTITLVFDSPIGLPADDLYKEEIEQLRNKGCKICEIISFGVSDAVRGSVKILSILYYSAYLLAWRLMKSTDFVVTVAARHEKFYCRAIKFKKIGPVRNYAKVNGIPTVLLNLPLKLPDMLKDKQRIFPLYLLNYSEQEELDIAERILDMHVPMSDEEFYTFFIEKTNGWEMATLAQKEYLRKIFNAKEADHASISRALAKGISNKLKQIENVHQNSEDKSIKQKIAKS